MNKLKYLIILLTCFLVACGTTPAQEKKEANMQEAAKTNVQLASGYIQRGQLEIAKGKLEKAIEQDPDFVPAYTTMAVLMEMINKPSEAENYYLDALDIDPHSPELQNNYGQFLCKQNKIDDAMSYFEKAVNNQFYERPERVYANMGYCLTLGDKPDYKKAESYLRKAIKMNPQMPSALLSMGELGIKTKQYLMARAYMQRYHAIARKSANSLWVQIQAERALGDKKYYVELSRELLKEFPDSPEADLLMEQARK
ncbi:MAG TPA: type IV pilus biogenesis/stability protein PilW [Gammaproteobacteria bacterium]|nr:type IV pilus biogenesis/stability protein PilW [Gammaproteobacteria bacterium]